MIDFNGKMYNMNGIYRVFIDGELVAEQKNKLTLLGRSNALKTMLGLVPSFAGSMGIGISSKANTSSGAYLNMADLDFSVGRYPITAASLGQNDAEDVLVYTARITDPSRYYITELGLYSNRLSSSFEADNRIIFNFESGDPLKTTKNFFNATISIATPAVITFNSHNLATGDSFTITTTGALPTGLVAGTTYYVTNSSTNTFNVSTTYANAIAGTKINTSGTQSGTHTINPSDKYYLDSIPGTPNILSNLTNYRIGNNAATLSGLNKSIIFNDSVLDLGYVAPYDQFVLAAYFTNATTCSVVFSSGAASATYTFNGTTNAYNVMAIDKNFPTSSSGTVDWSKIDTVTINFNDSDGSVILDGLRVKKYKTTDSVEGLVSRAVLGTPIEKPLGSVIDIQYLLEMEMVI